MWLSGWALRALAASSLQSKAKAPMSNPSMVSTHHLHVNCLHSPCVLNIIPMPLVLQAHSEAVLSLVHACASTAGWQQHDQHQQHRPCLCILTPDHDSAPDCSFLLTTQCAPMCCTGVLTVLSPIRLVMCCDLIRKTQPQNIKASTNVIDAFDSALHCRQTILVET